MVSRVIYDFGLEALIADLTEVTRQSLLSVTAELDQPLQVCSTHRRQSI